MLQLDLAPKLSNQELFDAIQATIKNYQTTSSQLSPMLIKHLEVLLKIQQDRAKTDAIL